MGPHITPTLSFEFRPDCRRLRGRTHTAVPIPAEPLHLGLGAFKHARNPVDDGREIQFQLVNGLVAAMHGHIFADG